MQSDAVWGRITNDIKKFDDAHQRQNGRTVRTEDELWDEMGTFLLTVMSGFCGKKGLKPKILLGTFVDLICPHESPS
jgi:hypothetical protein